MITQPGWMRVAAWLTTRFGGSRKRSKASSPTFQPWYKQFGIWKGRKDIQISSLVQTLVQTSGSSCNLASSLFFMLLMLPVFLARLSICLVMESTRTLLFAFSPILGRDWLSLFHYLCHCFMSLCLSRYLCLLFLTTVSFTLE